MQPLSLGVDCYASGEQECWLSPTPAPPVSAPSCTPSQALEMPFAWSWPIKTLLSKQVKHQGKKTGSVLRIWVHPSRCTLSPSPCCCGQRPDPHGHTSRCCPLASGWVWSIGGASRRSEVEGGKSQVPTWTVPGSPASLPRPQLLSGGCLHTTLFPPAPFLKGSDSF